MQARNRRPRIRSQWSDQWLPPGARTYRHVQFIQVTDATTGGVFGTDCKVVEDALEAPLFSSIGLRRMRLC
jgi:hypothetical protein